MQHYCRLSSVWIGEEEEQTIEYKLVEARIFKNFFLFLLQGVDSIEKANMLVRKYFFVPENNRATIQENEILIDHLVGSQSLILSVVIRMSRRGRKKNHFIP